MCERGCGRLQSDAGRNGRRLFPDRQGPSPRCDAPPVLWSLTGVSRQRQTVKLGWMSRGRQAARKKTGETRKAGEAKKTSETKKIGEAKKATSRTPKAARTKKTPQN